MNIVDPRIFKLIDMPLIVLVDNMQSFLSWCIKKHTKGNYSHVMWAHKPGYFASQDAPYGFREVPMETYIKPKFRLKFIRPKLTEPQKIILLNAIKTDLERKIGYDFLGILGQELHIPGIQNKYKDYCSEGISKLLHQIEFKVDFGKYPSPSDIARICKEIPTSCELIGYWFED